MKIGLIGYGKMGQAIERLAKEQGHEIAFTLKGDKINAAMLEGADVCIEFTGPESAYENLKTCAEAGMPVVSGTTGWLKKMDEINDLTLKNNSAFFYASNFSLGVNIFFALNEQLARIMNQFEQYNVHMEEVHHTAKKDAPSGTAITLLEGIIDNMDRKKDWELTHEIKEDTIPVSVKRVDPTPGTHSVLYSNPIDSIEITHTAKTRDGFALGAILAAVWLKDKTGIYSMKDLLTI